jgi:hypothetical protein
VLAAPPPNPVLREALDVLERRITEKTVGFATFAQFLRLHFAAGGAVESAKALPHFLTDGFHDGLAGLELVRELERRTGRRLLEYVTPTPAELREAARRLVP